MKKFVFAALLAGCSGSLQAGFSGRNSVPESVETDAAEPVEAPAAAAEPPVPVTAAPEPQQPAPETVAEEPRLQTIAEANAEESARRQARYEALHASEIRAEQAAREQRAQEQAQHEAEALVIAKQHGFESVVFGSGLSAVLSEAVANATPLDEMRNVAVEISPQDSTLIVVQVVDARHALFVDEDSDVRVMLKSREQVYECSTRSAARSCCSRAGPLGVGLLRRGCDGRSGR